VHAETGSEQKCLRCHDKAPVNLILYTKHAQKGDERTPFANDGCQTCHGDATAHRKKPRSEKPPIRFGADSPTPVPDQNTACLACHEKTHINWRGSPHDDEDLACGTCHDIHALEDPVRKSESQAEVCFACHQDKRLEMYKVSRHPLEEGIMTCSSCHNPHGSNGPSQLVKQTVNETCFKCHAEKRGPFLHEHEPVADSCVNCHNPHGTNNENMLVMRSPYLCQQCHVADRHVGNIYGSDGLDDTPGTWLSRTSRMTATGCSNCHSQIHGSNHPAGAVFRR
jgi:DmsE family decaheme c-type cytochrome